MDDNDYKRFMILLYISNSDKHFNIKDLYLKGLSYKDFFIVDRGNAIVDIGSYTLISNHFHLLLHEKIESGISIFMKKILTAYSMYFNMKYERTGSLFEGPFKARHIDNDAYLNWVFSYIHLNPVKLIEPNWKENGISNPESAKNFMQNYKYSSYHDYFIEGRPESVILNKEAFPEHFLNLNDFEDLVGDLRNPVNEV
jgi:REP element-mobilizing transposase RayT